MPLDREIRYKTQSYIRILNRKLESKLEHEIFAVNKQVKDILNSRVQAVKDKLNESIKHFSDELRIEIENDDIALKLIFSGQCLLFENAEELGCLNKDTGYSWDSNDVMQVFIKDTSFNETEAAIIKQKVNDFRLRNKISECFTETSNLITQVNDKYVSVDYMLTQVPELRPIYNSFVDPDFIPKNRKVYSRDKIVAEFDMDKVTTYFGFIKMEGIDFENL